MTQMEVEAARSSSPSERPERGDLEDPLHHALHHALHAAAHLLPSQAPIAEFVHHNTLHAFQHLPFHEALADSRAKMDTEGYLTEAEYRAAYAEGRIDDESLSTAIDEHLETYPQPPAPGPLSAEELFRIALLYPLPVETEAGLAWRIAETGALERLRPDLPHAVRERFLTRSVRWLSRRSKAELDALIPSPPLRRLERAPEEWAVAALWGACSALSKAPQTGRPELERVPAERTHRDLLLALTGVDPAGIVNPWLIRFTAAYLDQGMADWVMPGRADGMLACFRRIVRTALSPMPRALGEVPDRVAGHVAADKSAEEVVIEELSALGVPPDCWEGYLTRTLLSLAGWAGMINRLEENPQEADPTAGPPRLMEFLAIRLVLDRAACEHVARVELGHDRPMDQLLRRLRDVPPEPRPDQPARDEAAYRLFGVAQLAGLTAEDLSDMSQRERRRIIDRLDDFDTTTRRRVWQEAYDGWMRSRVLDAVATSYARPRSAVRPAPRAQLWFCIDDREESLRRHLEELSEEVETVGVAGFFGVAIAYKGLDAGGTEDLCPVPVDPLHEVHEEPDESHRREHDSRVARRRMLAHASHLWERGTRNLFRASFLTPLLGLLSAVPLTIRVLFPRLSGRLTSFGHRALLPAPRTVLTAVRPDDDHELHKDNRAKGFTISEAVERVATTLENCGSVDRFPPLIAVIGHGSTSANNPHAAAYDCGACAGKHGGPNARLFAELANMPEVREGLEERGIVIPDTTVFIGGFHDTCSDRVDLFDTEKVPASHAADLEWLRGLIETARRLDAHERCRKLESAPRNPTPEEALRHVEARSMDLGEARPELGHATNCISIVGRRDSTRGLFLDRRTFLTSYDPTIDPDGKILQRIMAAVGPVCAGINLEYYFSRVDNDRFGCGTKLPHNLSALLGVMDGHASDLRTGLPKQMIEIHEPVRLVKVIEASPATMDELCENLSEVRELIENAWMQVVLIDPDTGETYEYRPGKGYVPAEPDPTTLARAPSSRAHYGTSADTLSFALIGESAATAESEDEVHDRIA